MGISAENVLLMKNGKILELNEREAKFTTSVTSGNVMVDGLGVGDVGNIVLRDRQHLSQDGLIIVTVTMDSKGKVVAGPDVISRGFVYVRESENLMEEVKNLVNIELMRCEDNHITDWSIIKNSIRDVLKDYVLETTKRNPMILPIIEELKK